MSNEIEKDYETLCQEVQDKVTQALQLLKEAKEISLHTGTPVHTMGSWVEFSNLFDQIQEHSKAWDNSSWCAYGDDGDGWNDSGCSF